MKPITIKTLAGHYGKALDTLKKPVRAMFNQSTVMKDVRTKPAAPPAVSFNVLPPRGR